MTLALLEKKKFARLNVLVREIWEDADVPFYRDIWKVSLPPIFSYEELRRFPSFSWETLAACPLRARLYHATGLFTKIVYRDDKPFLIARTFADISEEAFGVESERPLLLFSSRHEALEKGVWQYEKNRLALMGDSSPEITAALASKYKIDGIVADTKSLKQYLPALASAYDRARIADVLVIDTSFDVPFMRKQFPEARLHATLALPEVGTIATAYDIPPGNDEPVFFVAESSLVEIDGALIVSRLLDLPTPFIRYRTDLQAFWRDKHQTLVFKA